MSPLPAASSLLTMIAFGRAHGRRSTTPRAPRANQLVGVLIVSAVVFVVVLVVDRVLVVNVVVSHAACRHTGGLVVLEWQGSGGVADRVR